MTTDDSATQHAILMNEVRYGERLCQRTARLYRRVQTVGTFGAVLSGSAAVAAVTQFVPTWVSATGAALFTVFGAVLLAVRPADKAASNEVDAKRYTALRVDALSMDVPAFRQALARLRTSDVAELESLRAVAYNDTLTEVGVQDGLIPLGPLQRLLARLA